MCFYIIAIPLPFQTTGFSMVGRGTLPHQTLVPHPHQGRRSHLPLVYLLAILTSSSRVILGLGGVVIWAAWYRLPSWVN